MSTDTIIDQAMNEAEARKYGGSAESRENLKEILLKRHIPLIHETEGFESLKALGRGTFAKVELIRYQNKLYAHKIPLSGNAIQRASIIEEGVKLSQIGERHRNIQQLNYVTWDRTKHVFGIVIDYCSSGSLDNIVKSDQANYNFFDVINWGYQLADALNFLHQKKITHRDVKIQNILLKDNQQTLVLTDYGTATSIEKVIMTGGVGTPITMAPEVFSTRNYTEKCDIFSWAIVLWQLFSRKLYPYDVQTKSFIFQVVQDKLRPDKLRDCPPLFSALLYRSWHSNPNERPSFWFIKTVMKLILDKLPKPVSEFRREMHDETVNQWVRKHELPAEYLPTVPRSDDIQSMNIYQEHIQVLQRIMPMHERIKKLEQYKALLEENERLKNRLDELNTQ